MAVSEVQVAKLALQHIGDRYDITSLSDQTAEAEQVNLVFENARDAMQAHFRGLLGSMIDVTETQALEELRKQASESRQRYLNSIAHSGTP